MESTEITTVQHITSTRDKMTQIIMKKQFVITTLIFQLIFIVLFACFAKYDEKALPNNKANQQYISQFYPLFQDVHVMIFIGFGFLMTFLKRYGLSSVSLNMLLAAFVLQWAMLFRGFFHLDNIDGRFPINVESLLTADFSAAVVLISMGALLGKLSPVQYLIMGFLETTISYSVEHIVFDIFKANDIGGSMVVHAFGAYFGLTVARIMHRKELIDHVNESSVYHSDIFAMIGTLFLWSFWPSFNAAVAVPEDARQRAILNTYLAMSAGCLVAFMVSSLVDTKGRFNMVHVQNSTLAGGVAVGTTANLLLQPWLAVTIGGGAGAISVIGYRFLTPLMAELAGVHDTCGVNNLHGMPAILAGLIGIGILLVPMHTEQYGDSLDKIFPAMTNATRTATEQAAYQAASLGLVLLTAIVGGIICGFILKIPLWNDVNDDELHDDSPYFETPDDFEFTTKVAPRADAFELQERLPLKSEYA